MLDLDLWSTRFVESMRLRNWSERTIVNYRGELAPFFEYLDEHGVTSLGELTRSLVEGYRVHLFYQGNRTRDRARVGQPLAPPTQARRLCAIKAFTRWLHRQGFLLVDPAAGLELPRTRRTVPELLSEEETRRLLESACPSEAAGGNGRRQTPLELRDRAILEVLYGTGIRNAELRALRLESVDRARHELRVQQGKNRKSRVLPLGEEALGWLERYLTEGRALLKAPGEEPLWLFLSWRGRRLDHGSVRGVVQRAAVRANLDKRVFPHLLRHCCATHMLAHGAGVRHLQLLLGHASLGATQRYTQLEISDLRRVLLSCHPRERS